MKLSFFIKCAVILAALSLMYPGMVASQSRFHVVLDYHYNWGLNESGYHYSLSRHDMEMYGNSLHLTAFYKAAKRLSLGIGIGADRYESPSYNTFPLFVSGHYQLLPVRLPGGYVYSNLGYSIGREGNTTKGWLGDLGLGYKKMFRKHFGLNFQLGYNLKQFKGIPTYDVVIIPGAEPDFEVLYLGEKNSLRHSLSVGIGLIL